MPNKHKFSKLKTKLLAKGKMSENKNVQSTMKYIEEKALIDNEDINYDFDEKKCGFERLPDEDECNKKIKKMQKAPPKKRKLDEEESVDAAKKKQAKTTPEQTKPIKAGELPKKSKKNKYFFMAHPEKLKDNALIQETSANTNFVIDQEKMKLNELKKKAKKIVEKTQKSVSKKANKSLKPKDNNVWQIEECDSDEADENQIKHEQPTAASQCLDFKSFEKNFKIKKVIEKMDDGTLVEVYKPEMEDSDSENSEIEEENEAEPEEDEEVHADEEVVEEAETKPKKEPNPNNASVRNQMLEKLQSSRFRYINELLYTQPSDKSFKYFQK